MRQFYPIDAMAVCESVRLLVSATIPDDKAGRWAKLTPVTIRRLPAGFTYESEHGMTAVDAADFQPGDNVGHRGLYAHVNARGAQLFQAMRERDLIADAYAYHRNAYQRPHGAAEAIELARADLKHGRTRYPVKVRRGSDGEAVQAYGELMRWIESPASKGLRFVGYADELAKLRHNGWFMDHDQHETVRAVVYQLPGRDGVSRFVAGYGDPYNGRADDGGAACIAVGEVFESDFAAEMRTALASIGKQYHSKAMQRPGYWAEAAHETARNEAARRADAIAERMAEESREHNAAWQAGSRYADESAEVARLRASTLQTVARVQESPKGAPGRLYGRNRLWRPLRHGAPCRAIEPARYRIGAGDHATAEGWRPRRRLSARLVHGRQAIAGRLQRRRRHGRFIQLNRQV